MILELFAHLVVDPLIQRLERRWPNVNVRWWLAVGLYLSLMVLLPTVVVSLHALFRDDAYP